MIARLLLMSALCLSSSTFGQAAQVDRGGRHALIIGVGQYADARISPLRGIPHDVSNARQLAGLMGVPESNTTVLVDRDATNGRIRRALRELASRVRDGDRVFVYYSGHGARFAAPDNTATCHEALVPSDVDVSSKAGLLTQDDIAADLAPAYAKADKVIVFVDACHSGGVRLATRAGQQSEADDLMPKFTSLDAPPQCRVPSNVRTRSVGDAARQRGAPAPNVVQLSSSRPDEISLDSAQTGGLATSSLRYCATYADDSDGSGSLSLAEIAACVQRRIDERLAGHSRYTGQHLVLAGNVELAPFLSSGPVRQLSSIAAARPPDKAGGEVASSTVAQPFPLESVVAQADGRHKVTVRPGRSELKIGVDFFDLSVQSSRGGFVYLILQSSDGKSTYVLFPNALDHNNRIAAGEWMHLPRVNWRLRSQGPAGTNRLLVMVTDSPRDLAVLRSSPEGPFVKTLNDQESARSLAWLVGSAKNSASAQCASGFERKDLQYVEECSDSFGATIVRFVER